jgi:hypothetical protein
MAKMSDNSTPTLSSPCLRCTRRSECRTPCTEVEQLVRVSKPRPMLRLLGERPAPTRHEMFDGESATLTSELCARLELLPVEQRFALLAGVDGESVAVLEAELGLDAHAVRHLQGAALSALRKQLAPFVSDPLPTVMEMQMTNSKGQGSQSSERPRSRTKSAKPARAESAEPTDRRDRGLGVRSASPEARQAAAALVEGTPTARISVETITPELALALLERNKNNRTIVIERVHGYARDMRDGVWHVNNQGLGFGANGELYDGQHRLLAVVKANIAVPMIVVRDIGVQARGTIDMGRSRSVGDTLAMIDGEENGNRFAAWIRVIHELHGEDTRGLTMHLFRERIERYRPSLRWFEENVVASRHYGRAAILGALVFAHHVVGAKIEPFIRGYASGAGLDEGAPALRLRSLTTGAWRTAFNPTDASRITLRCARAFLLGEALPTPVRRTNEGYEYFRSLQQAATLAIAV